MLLNCVLGKKSHLDKFGKRDWNFYLIYHLSTPGKEQI